jgi:signal transduction histidine kinase
MSIGAAFAALFRRTLPAALLVPPGPLRAEDRYVPYQADHRTLHLWHLDETAAPFTDAAPAPVPLTGLLNGGRAGLPSLPGFGSAVSFRANAGGVPGSSDFRGAILSAAATLANSDKDNVPAGFRYGGEDGAFTFELLVRPEVRPQDAEVVALGLISMDGDGEDRVFNFRIEKQGFLAFITLPHCGATGGGLASIPTTGPHAYQIGEWFHVAVTYDGNAGVTNNLKLYWTRIGSEAVRANLIGRGTLSNDLNGNTGDLAIGNEARSFSGNAEGEPFPGLIDEVRISSVARDPADYCFVPVASRKASGESGDKTAPADAPERLDLKLSNVLVDASAATLPKPGGTLKLGSGLHRLDFDFGFDPERMDTDVKLRCQLEGIDERWQETERGMSLIYQALDSDKQVISQASFPAVGRSSGWETTPEDSAMTRRNEPVYLPAGTSTLRISLSSGSPDTTGLMVIDNLALREPGQEASIWTSGAFDFAGLTPSPADLPPGWLRGGADPAIAYLVIRSGGSALGLVDGDQEKHGEWVAAQDWSSPVSGGRTMVLSWDEAYNVIGGALNRATYINVPAGDYTFRVIGLAGEKQLAGEIISLPIQIAPPFWRRLWFWPVVAAGSVGLVAAGIFRHMRRRSKQRLEKLKFQNALEQDRSRIARDMHDDLGTRVTVLNMTAALARRDIVANPTKAARHLDKMTESARELVEAMDDLVWAVNPSHDTLDHLASHLTRLAEEMFRDSPVRCRLDIPAILPARPLGSEFRHHVALSVKESLHNVLQHAGPCEVFLSLALEDEKLAITIRDTGRGFDPVAHPQGHGLGNTATRIREIGGSYALDSTPGQGTSIRIACPLPEHPR